MRLLLLVLLLFNLPADQKMVKAPHLGFLYDGQGRFIILADEGLDLIDSNGKVIKHHSENLLGNITSLDRTSFMRLLLFYGDVPGFQILDNTLSPHTELVDLNLLGFPFITAMCMSSNNSYWMLDNTNYELIRIDERGRILSNSGNLIPLVGRSVSPFKMIESGARVFMAEKDQGLLIFDQFGVYMNTLDIPGLLDFCVVEDDLYFLHVNGVATKKIEEPFIKELTLDVRGFKCIDANVNSLFLGNGEVIRTYPR
jgi:hypothetical protein